MNILITGIYSLLGPELVKTFKGKNTIYGLDLVTSEIEGVRNIFTYNELKSIPNVDVVIHLDGKYMDANNLSEALVYFENNAGLTRKIFNWFTQSTAKTFIYFSSVKAVANSHIGGVALTEEMEPKPFGVLGESKLLAERYILDLSTFGKKIYILRPAIIHGSGCLGSKDLRMMYEWVKKGLPFPFGKFVCRRSFTGIDNLAYVLKRMLELDIPAGIYHVVDDEPLLLAEIYEMMGYFLHRKVRMWHCSKWLIHLVAWLGIRFHWHFDEYQYQKLSSDFVASNEKLKKALGIEKLPFSVVDGFNKSIVSFDKKMIES